MTATVESVNEPMDLTAIATENVVTAVARSVTLSDADVGKSDLILPRRSLIKNNHPLFIY